LQKDDGEGDGMSVQQAKRATERKANLAVSGKRATEDAADSPAGISQGEDDALEILDGRIQRFFDRRRRGRRGRLWNGGTLERWCS
jgi:hypothetical protein